MKNYYRAKKIFIALILMGGLMGIVFSVWLYPKVFHAEAFIRQSKELLPNQAVYVDFTYPVFVKKYQNNIRVIPEIPVDFSWEPGNKRLAITPKTFWEPETIYSIRLPEGRSIALTKIPATEIKFFTEKYPKVVNFTPENEARDVLLDIEDPIVVNFDKSAKDFFIKFSVDPESEVGYENNADKTQFRLIPRQDMSSRERAGRKYTVTVEAKYAGDAEDNYKKIYQSSFSTLPPPAPKVWEKDFSLRLEQARKFTQPQILEGKYIDINLATQIMSTFSDGKLLDSYLISTGKRGMETPKGRFQIQNKTPRAWSHTYGLFMPFWMAILPSGKVGIHELPEWPGGYKEGANHLGTPVSHGCVRLGVGPAKVVYDWADIGTPVVVY